MKKYSIIIIGLVVLFFSSCTEKIDLELDETYTRLVVEGDITNEPKSHTVKLTLTSSYFENQPAPKVEEATVTISNGTTVFQLTETTPGVYQTAPDVQGEVGKTYTLNIDNVTIDGVTKSYTASCNLRSVPLLDSIIIEYMDTWEYWVVIIYTLDPPTTDFYMFNVYNNSILLSDTIDEVVITNDQFFNGSYTHGISAQWFRESEADVGDTITFEMSSITEEHYKFIEELQIETGFSGPTFGGPPANVQGNINNGALGVFGAYSVTRKSNTMKEK